MSQRLWASVAFGYFYKRISSGSAGDTGVKSRGPKWTLRFLP